jgi:hypothetical protein
VAPAYDIKQWRQACREAGLVGAEKDEASDDFHAEKRAFGDRRHLPYGDLIIWLREWREDRWNRP